MFSNLGHDCFYSFSEEAVHYLLVNKLTEKFSQRRKSLQISSSSNLQSEIPVFDQLGYQDFFSTWYKALLIVET